MRIAIITGGETGEREISIESAKNIQEEIDFAETELFVFPEDSLRFTERVKNFDLAIPAIHGAGGEDGTLQDYLKSLEIPFIFSDTHTHTIGINKRKTKEKAREIGIMTPEETSTFPLFAKPINGGSSVASRLCTSAKELEELQSSKPETDFLTEELIKGREFTVGVIEYRGETSVLPVIEIIFKAEFFDFESKYNTEKLAQEICPAEIDSNLSKELQKQALNIHNHLQARHLSRSDFIVTPDNKIYFLEINTIPGMTKNSLVPKMLKEVKIKLKEILKDWCISHPIS